MNINEPSLGFKLEVWDKDSWSTDDFMGGSDVSLAGLEPNEPRKMVLALSPGDKDSVRQLKHGTIEADITWVPLDS